MKRLRRIKSEKGVVLLVVLSFTVALLVTIGGLLFSKGEEAVAGTQPPFCDNCPPKCDDPRCPPTPIIRPHFKCYNIAQGPALNEPVKLTDQFGIENVTVKTPHYLCTVVFVKCRVIKGVESCERFPIDNSDGNVVGDPALKCYKIAPSGPPVGKKVKVCDQFHKFDPNPNATDPLKNCEDVTVKTPELLCTPAEKFEKF